MAEVSVKTLAGKKSGSVQLDDLAAARFASVFQSFQNAEDYAEFVARARRGYFLEIAAKKADLLLASTLFDLLIVGNGALSIGADDAAARAYTMAGAIAGARRRAPGEKILMIHTGGSPALFAYEPELAGLVD